MNPFIVRRVCTTFALARSSLRSHKFSTAESLNESLVITKSCAQRIKQLRDKSKNDKLNLRVAVEGGGCSGFKYVFTMDDSTNISEEDKLFNRDGANVVIDTTSFEFIKGATVDFEQDMMRSAFAIVNNPQSESACGCGSSFAVKNFSVNPAID